jgi:circadian clock protein KaiC
MTAYKTRLTSGIPGLDAILDGGLPAAGMYLLQGNPGVGKTTFSLQFLLAGAAQGEKALYVSFSETRAEIDAVAESHRWQLGGLTISDLNATDRNGRETDQTMFHPSEVELEETMRPLLAEIEALRPARVVIDSLSELRLLARDSLRYRRQLLSLKSFLIHCGCTVLLVDDRSASREDDAVQAVVHGIFSLEKYTPAYGTPRRRLTVDKLRGVKYREGFHDFIIDQGGIIAFPRPVPPSQGNFPVRPPVSSGLPELDALLAGGLARGTSTLLVGPPGSGKSALAAQYALAAAGRGERAAIFTYEESVDTWQGRARAFGSDPDRHITSRQLCVEQVTPADMSPGQLAAQIVKRVEDDGVSLVVIDSLDGLHMGTPDETFLRLHLHDLLAYLRARDVTTLLVAARNTFHVSHLVDSLLSLRNFETSGAVRQAITVIKNRNGRHERSLRELRLTERGIEIVPREWNGEGRAE